MNAGNAARLIDSSDDRSAKLAHMAQVSSIAERLKLRSAHFAQRPLYGSLDQLCNLSMTLAGTDSFDAAMSENARLFGAVDIAAKNLVDERLRLLGDAVSTDPGRASGTA